MTDTVSIQVDRDLWQLVNDKASREGINATEIITRAMIKYAGPLDGVRYESSSAANLLGGSIIISEEWNDKNSVHGSRFIMQRCIVELIGLDVVIRPAPAPPVSPIENSYSPVIIADCLFRRV